MKIRIEYPYVLVYEGEKNRVRYVLRKCYDLTTTLDSDTVGKFLIDFILLPITDYKRRLGELTESVPADFTVDNELAFAMYSAEIYDLAKQLQEKQYFAGFFLMVILDQVFSAEISDADKIKLAVKVLEEVITLQEIFSDGLTMCCDVEYDKEGLSPSDYFLQLPQSIRILSPIICKQVSCLRPQKVVKWTLIQWTAFCGYQQKRTACQNRQAEG